ncbi:MAG: adenylate/guanylate cyclase domain-containing protein, partial [Syntrophorhabdales bacterium]
MAPQELKRKLTAILSADVKGYSRLMGEDEEWTVHTLNTYKDMMRGLIQQHRGRIVDSPGDNVLAEFASVVDAVQCSVEIQQVLRAKNAMLPENRRMEFRIGINLGDVIEEGDSIYGDGVNIAARLEGLAEAGGICISESAYQQIENKLPLRYDYVGEHEVKNIAKPVRVYRARLESEAALPKGKGKKPVGKRVSKAALGILAVLIITGAAILYQFVLRPSPSKMEVASKDKMAFPLPDKPSIAVLPFVN